jgi:hypothetical protein
VHLWQIAIEHDDVIRLALRAVKRLLAVEGEVDRHPLATEPDRDGRGELSVVFDDQDTHRGPLGRECRVTQECRTAGYRRVTAPVPLL